MNEILSYISSEALIVVPVLLVLGKMLKETSKIKNWFIPYILLVIGTGATVAIMGVSVDAFIQGVLVSGASVFSDQLVKQATNRENKGDR